MPVKVLPIDAGLEQRVGIDRLGIADVRDAVSAHVRAAAPDDAHGGTRDGVALHPLRYLSIQGREQGVIIDPIRRNGWVSQGGRRR